MVKNLVENIVEKIDSLVKAEIEDQKDLFLVDIIKKGKTAGGKVIVLLDGDDGITIERCAKVSRTVSRFIDEELNITEPLTLEVSSAGLDHPLKLNRQYHKNIGKSIKVTLNDSSDRIGVLKSVNNDFITIEISEKKKKQTELEQINFENINKTVVIVSFK